MLLNGQSWRYHWKYLLTIVDQMTIKVKWNAERELKVLSMRSRYTREREFI